MVREQIDEHEVTSHETNIGFTRSVLYPDLTTLADELKKRLV
jgi:hypothetical protein